MTTEAIIPDDASTMSPVVEKQPDPAPALGSVITTTATDSLGAPPAEPEAGQPESSQPEASQPAPVVRPSGPPQDAPPAEVAVRGQAAPAVPARKDSEELQPARLAPASILVIDIGGTNV